VDDGRQGCDRLAPAARSFRRSGAVDRRGEAVNPVRFGIIGAGRVAQDFAVAIREVPGAALTVVWSRSTRTAERFLERFPEARAVSDQGELVSASDVDVVYIATPHHRHAPDSLLALRHDKAVLVEKPFATSAAEASTIVDEARARELFCMEAMWMRCVPGVRRAKELVDEGAIGEPKMLIADFGVTTPYDPASRFFDPAQGGGALLDRGVYAVSLAHLLFGVPDSVVGLSVSAPTGVDEQAGALLRFPGGRLAVVAAALSSTTPNAAVITGTEGSIEIESPFYCPTRLAIVSAPSQSLEAGGPAGPTVQARVGAALKHSRLGVEVVRVAKSVLRRPRIERLPLSGSGYAYEVAEVVRCLRAGLTESPLMPLDDSVAVMATLDRVRGTDESAQAR
jgi:predicted dehydrogenase